MRFILVVLLTSCLTQSHNFKVNDCVQQADELTVWRIISIHEDELNLELVGREGDHQEKKVSARGMIITSCPDQNSDEKH